MSFISKIKTDRRYFYTALALVLLFPFCLWPMLALFIKTTEQGGIGYAALTSVSTLMALKNTFFLSLMVALFSTLVAVPIAFIITRTDLMGAKYWRSAFCLPYIMPPYIAAIAWIILGNPSNGLLNKLFGEGAWVNIYTFGGLIFVETSYYYTFVLLTILQAFDRMDPSLEEAARISGANHWTVFKSITLPLIRPSLISGLLLVFLATAASFGVPALIGTPAGIYFLTTRIYTFQRMGTLAGTQQSVVLSLILLGLAVIVLFATMLPNMQKDAKTVSGKSARQSSYLLGPWQWPLQTFFIAIYFVIFILPIMGTLLAALSKVQGVLTWNNFGFLNFSKVLFEVSETKRAFYNSFMVAAGAATVTTIGGFVLAYHKTKSKKLMVAPIDFLTTLPYATPGTVIALGLILAFLGFGPTKALYLTPWMLMFAYVAKYFSFSLRTSSDGLSQLDDSLGQAARVAGAKPLQVLTSIWIPLIKTSMIAGWFLVFMPSLSELTMTILLSGPGLETIGTLLFQLQEYGESGGGGASVISIILVIIIFLMNFLVKLLSKGRYGL